MTDAAGGRPSLAIDHEASAARAIVGAALDAG